MPLQSSRQFGESFTKKPIAITMGEPGGIGPELTLKAYSHFRAKSQALPFFVIGPLDLYLAERERLGALDLKVKVIDPQFDLNTLGPIFKNALPILPINSPVSASKGVACSQNGAAVIESITTAHQLVTDGAASAMVTNPIQKASLQDIGFQFPGHTEYLQALSRAAGAPNCKAVMLLHSQALSVVPLTIHIPLRDVANTISSSLIVETAQIILREFKQRFGISSPRLAVAGLNPHAGEGGKMGHEDDEIIRPAINQLLAQGHQVSGPHSADTLFHKRARLGYDCVLTMYHDQGLIPIKTIAFDEGVNTTLGLPIIRTSPDHGTALDIAHDTIAKPDSLIAAIKLAQDLGQSSQP